MIRRDRGILAARLIRRTVLLFCVHALVSQSAWAGCLHFQKGIETGVTDAWRTVTLTHTYQSMVVVCTPQYTESQVPAVVRVRNAAGNQFDMRLQNPGGSAVAPANVSYVVLEEGVYDETFFGVKLEAQKKVSTITDHRTSWVGEVAGYWNNYANPVVLGQVMTFNDPDWSTFWCFRGGNQPKRPPNGGSLAIGKHVGEDPDITRADETLGYIVIEAGDGTIDNVRFWAALGKDLIAGMGSNPPYEYDTDAVPVLGGAVAVQCSMESNNGGWAVLYAPVVDDRLNLAIDEDQIGDGERTHGKEQVAYLVFGSEDAFCPATLEFEVVSSTAVENNTTVDLMVSLSSPSVVTATVDYVVTDGSADPGLDYNLPPGTLTFLPGETNQAISVQLLEDTESERDETVLVQLLNEVNAPLGVNEHELTIIDDGDGEFVIEEAWYDEDIDGVSFKIDRDGGQTYDLLYVDANSFTDSLSNQWQLATRGTDAILSDTGAVDRVAPIDLPPGVLRFYRLSKPGLWEGTTDRRAGTQIYCYCPVQLFAGQNWVSLWGIPDVNELREVVGHELPKAKTPNDATRISWYERTGVQTAYREVWLAKKGKNNAQWRFSVGGGAGKGQKADGEPLPLEEGFIVELPVASGQMVLPLVLQIPQSGTSQVIKGNYAYNLISFVSPQQTHPGQANLLESGFTGSWFPIFSDVMWKFSGAGQVVPDAIWYDTISSTWRLMSNGFPEVPPGYLRPGEAYVIQTRGSAADWTWAATLNYSMPTSDMNP